MSCEDARPDPEWDGRVEATEGPELAQTTLWAQTRQMLGYRAFHVRLHGAGGALLGGFLMYVRRLAPGVGVASVPRGPVLFANPGEAAPPLVGAMLQLAWKRGGRLLLVAPAECSAAVEEAMAIAGFRDCAIAIAPQATLRLDLRQSEKELLAGMKSTRRRHLARALDQNFTVEDSDDVELFHRLHVSTATRQGFTPVQLPNLRAQWQALGPAGRCRITIVRHQGVAMAGLWTTSFGGTVIFKLAGWDAESGGPRYASVAAHWAAIRQAREEGAHTYDFGGLTQAFAASLANGAPPPPGVHEIPDGFTLGFGGTPILLPGTRFALTPGLAHWTLAGGVQRALASPRVRSLAQRMRGG